MSKDRIAIIGIGCRFPGGINDTHAFWKLLAEGREAVRDVPADRWNVERYYDAEPGVVGKSIAKRGGFLDAIDQFDPQFFGISPREAPYVDPQHRLMLETAWEAIEDAGLVIEVIREPAPSDKDVSLDASAERWRRIPLFLHLRARRDG